MTFEAAIGRLLQEAVTTKDVRILASALTFEQLATLIALHAERHPRKSFLEDLRYEVIRELTVRQRHQQRHASEILGLGRSTVSKVKNSRSRPIRYGGVK